MPAFPYRLGPAEPTGGWQEDDSWLWDGSVIQGDDGLWHMFASRWSRSVPFHPNWVTNSRVVRATSPTPGGPYRYAGEVLPARGDGWWDGRMTHSPTVRRQGDHYLLFYTGTSYREPAPTGPAPAHIQSQARRNQRIGLAWALDPAGPWTRGDEPLLQPRPGRWDSTGITNAAPCFRSDGSLLLLYKSSDGSARHLLRYGVAGADSAFAPVRRLREDPIVWRPDADVSYEDASVWFADGRYHLMFNDMTGALTGEDHGGGYGWSDDGVHWQLGDPPVAYSRRIRWADQSETTQGSFERVQLIYSDGRPTHLVGATGDGPGHWMNAQRTWIITVPIEPAAAWSGPGADDQIPIITDR